MPSRWPLAQALVVRSAASESTVMTTRRAMDAGRLGATGGGAWSSAGAWRAAKGGSAAGRGKGAGAEKAGEGGGGMATRGTASDDGESGAGGGMAISVSASEDQYRVGSRWTRPTARLPLRQEARRSFGGRRRAASGGRSCRRWAASWQRAPSNGSGGRSDLRPPSIRSESERPPARLRIAGRRPRAEGPPDRGTLTLPVTPRAARHLTGTRRAPARTSRTAAPRGRGRTRSTPSNRAGRSACAAFRCPAPRRTRCSA